jgi:ABC-type sugar transport system ATPase subunit
MSSTLSLVAIHKRYEGRGVVLDGFELEVATGELVAVVGASGCGKTTALRIVAGVEPPTSGRVLIDGADVTRHTPGQRDVASVFQGGALYPHLTVFENLAFGLRLRQVADEAIAPRVAAIAETLGLAGLLTRGPRALSGGERQRVALGRALVCEPRVLLFDEPLSSLDPRTRAELRGLLRRAHDTSGATTLYVTHDPVDAAALADRIVVMRDGGVVQDLKCQRATGLRTQSSTCL